MTYHHSQDDKLAATCAAAVKAAFEGTSMSKEVYRRKFVTDMLPRLGYAAPIHSHLRARDEEWEVLAELAAEGLVVRATQKTDKHGYANTQGRSTSTVYVLAERTPEADKTLWKRHGIKVAGSPS